MYPEIEKEFGRAQTIQSVLAFWFWATIISSRPLMISQKGPNKGMGRKIISSCIKIWCDTQHHKKNR
jgi:hypothetical protein